VNRPLFGVAVTTVLAAVLACGGGGKHGSPPVQPGPVLSFSASTSGANSVSLVQAGQSNGTTLQLTVQANQVSALYGVAFDVVYPSNLLTFSSATAASFLAGVSTSFQVKETSPGRIVIGYSRLGAAPGVTGSGPLVNLTFVSKGVMGTGTIGFENRHAFDSNANEIASVSWAGGSVSVVP